MRALTVIKKIVGPLEANSYLLISGREALVIDPGWTEAYHLGLQAVRERVEVKLAVATHGHFDHVMGYWALAEALGYEPPLAVSRADWHLIEAAGELARLFGLEPPERWRPPRRVSWLGEGDVLEVGGVEVRVIETPGHTPGSITLLAPGYAFTGDTLFKGSIGRTDLPGGSWAAMMRSLRRLARLEGSTIVMPGHGPETTIAEEVRGNPFVKIAVQGG